MAKKKFSLDKEALYNKLMPSNTEDTTNSNSTNPITSSNPLFTADSGANKVKSNEEMQSQSATKEEHVVEIEQANIAQSTIQNDGEPVEQAAIATETASQDNGVDHETTALTQQEEAIPETTPRSEDLGNEIVDKDTDNTIDTTVPAIEDIEAALPSAQQENALIEDIVENVAEAVVEDVITDNYENEAIAKGTIVEDHENEPAAEAFVDDLKNEVIEENMMINNHEEEISLSEQTTKVIVDEETVSSENMESTRIQEEQVDQDSIADESALLEPNLAEEKDLADVPPIAVTEEPKKPAILKHNTEVNINALSISMPINLIERIVWANINTILSNNQICTCRRCQADATSIALNKITVKYISCFSPDQALGDFYYKTHFAEIMSAMLLACSIVKNAPRHDEQNPVPEDTLYVHNLTEDLVITQIKKMLSSYSGCCCDRCLSDIAAIMLNNIPPKYFITSEGKLFAKLVLMEQQYHVDLTTQFFKASHLVQQSPNH